MNDMSNTPATGHNNPPPETVEDEVAEALAPFLPRLADVETRYAALPVDLSSDDERGKAAEVGRDARALGAEIEDVRKQTGAPYLEATRIVNAGFATESGRAGTVLTVLLKRVSDYDKAKATKARREAELAEAKAREEQREREVAAAKAAAEGRTAQAMKHAEKADQAAEDADRARAIANKSTNDLTRVKHGTGPAVSASAKWKGEIVDVSKLSAEALWALVPFEAKQKAVDAWVKNNTSKSTRDAPALAGVRIFQDVRTRL